MKSKSELLAYSIKIIERGDGYRSLINFLNNNGEDEKLIEEIVSDVGALEKEGKIKVVGKADKSLPHWI